MYSVAFSKDSFKVNKKAINLKFMRMCIHTHFIHTESRCETNLCFLDNLREE